ncbi:MAG: hypothetical protein ACXW5U_15780 [Thermoanaerobaculia bacterium]
MEARLFDEREFDRQSVEPLDLIQHAADDSLHLLRQRRAALAGDQERDLGAVQCTEVPAHFLVAFERATVLRREVFQQRDPPIEQRGDRIATRAMVREHPAVDDEAKHELRRELRLDHGDGTTSGDRIGEKRPRLCAERGRSEPRHSEPGHDPLL